MNSQAFPMCSVELVVNICADRYLAEVRVDGELKEQLEFLSQQQLARWAGANPGFAGGDIYVHIRSRQPGHKRRALELADRLSRQGLIIGISRQRPVCRSQRGRLQ